MTRNNSDFTIGIEEEFFLVDTSTFDCVDVMPEELRREVEAELGDRVNREVLGSMIEINSGVHQTVRTAVSEIAELRRRTARLAARHGTTLVAAGTHPFADWREQQITPKARYRDVAHALQALSKRMHVCGLHIHVAVQDPELRIQLMNRMQPFLPLFLAMSTSSPFWRGQPTGLKGYRTAANREGPRSGLPGKFAGIGEYESFVERLVAADVMADGSFLWWAIRPSVRFPTLELRVTDCCTRLRDVAALAALYQSLLLYMSNESGRPDAEPNCERLVDEENMWLAVRHGIDGRFIGPEPAAVIPAVDWARATSERVAHCAATLDCSEELSSVMRIFDDGTSADYQLSRYEAALADGAEPHEATRLVTKALAARSVGASILETSPS